MKILDDWKVYGGVSDLKQPMEGIPVSQVIINSNYSDDHDDYDIALMRLSRPLALSGEGSQLAGCCLGRCTGPELRPGCRGVCGALPAGAASSAVPTRRVPWPGRVWQPQPWAQLCPQPQAGGVGREGSLSCSPRSSLAAGPCRSGSR